MTDAMKKNVKFNIISHINCFFLFLISLLWKQDMVLQQDISVYGSKLCLLSALETDDRI